MRPRALFFVLALISSTTLSSFASVTPRAAVARTVVINAPLARVWDALKAERLKDPAHRHIISHSGSEYEVQERFDGLPVIGSANCVYSEHEIDRKRIEYKLISSDKFVAFEGSWDLTPCEDGQATQVTLTSFADTGMHVPFASKITRCGTTDTVVKRLDELKKVASTPGDNNHVQLAIH